MTTALSRRTNYSGYRILNRDQLLTVLAATGLPAEFDRVIAAHVTYAYPDNRTAPAARDIRIVGHASGDGVQALLVEVDGTTVRPDGRLFHLTYSLAEGRRPVESNALLARVPVTAVAPIALAVEPF